MKAIAIPTKFPIPFASSAAPDFINPIPTTTPNPNIASLELGFPPANATDVAAGGVPPNVKDENGILNQVTAWCQWVAAGGAPMFYDASFQTTIAGYPQGAVVMSSALGNSWQSTVDDNLTNPDDPNTSAGWVGLTNGIAHGQVTVIVNSPTQLIMFPYNGGGLIINGFMRRTPFVGVALSNSGLLASTAYHIYAGWSGSAITLVADTVGSALGTNGVRTKAGDPTLTLVAVATTTAAGQFADNLAQRLLFNFFNRTTKPIQGANTSGATTASNLYVPLAVGSNVSFITGFGEAYSLACHGVASLSIGGNTVGVQIGINNVAVGINSSMTTSLANGSCPLTAPWSDAPTLGTYTATPFGSVTNAGIGSFSVLISGTVRG